jgi:hypothetical protein
MTGHMQSNGFRNFPKLYFSSTTFHFFVIFSVYSGYRSPAGIWMCAYVGCIRPGHVWLKKEGFLEELGSRNWQIVGPEARYVG